LTPGDSDSSIARLYHFVCVLCHMLRREIADEGVLVT